MRLAFVFQSYFCILPLIVCAGQRTLGQKPHADDHHRPRVILGILEDLPGHYTGEPDFRAVRVVFQKVDGDWKAFPTNCSDQECLKTLTKSYPGQVNWTIAFEGRNIGRVTSQVPNDFAWYAEVGLEKILGSAPIPTIGKQSEEYAGWNGKPVYRPLAAVSETNFKDPDGWKHTQLTPDQIALVRQSFRKMFPSVSNCRNPEENLPKPWKYRDGEIKLSMAYSSRHHWLLAKISLEGYACDGPIDDGGAFDSQWYGIDPAGEVRHIGSGMSLLDAGDYDSDGRSEVLFTVSGYAEGGYRLFYHDFSKSAEFLLAITDGKERPLSE